MSAVHQSGEGFITLAPPHAHLVRKILNPAVMAPGRLSVSKLQYEAWGIAEAPIKERQIAPRSIEGDVAGGGLKPADAPSRDSFRGKSLIFSVAL